jgi:DNA invertase Pin-like site-specific DNA recombinase
MTTLEQPARDLSGQTLTRFAFYGRVSTEDNQDPEASRAWQLSRARALITPRGGEIVVEFFDVDKSRSIPWSRRPHAAALLAELKNPNRDFDAVVIGEPHRAFYGNQYGLTFPVFEHFRVQMWVPEVGGPIDPANEAHDMIMGVFGGLSKGERNRIKIRVRAAMAAITATEGRYLGGRPPYGYRLADAGPHPNPSKAADGKRLHRLEPDPETAPVVQRIFAEYLAGRGRFAIAEGLTADGIPSPSAHDRARNRHRCGIAWAKSAVRAILINPRYTGRQVWNKQRKDEVLIDVDDVALGHTTKMRWNAADQWIWSEHLAHEPLVSVEDFEQAQAVMDRRQRAEIARRPRPTRRPYAYRGVLFCGYCERRMQGNWNNDQAYYRCRFPAEYALANRVDHPKTVYLREAEILDDVDAWLAELFLLDRLEVIVDALASQGFDPDEAQASAVRSAITECDRRLGRYKAALEAGADPVEVTRWINAAKADRARAEEQLRGLGGGKRMSRQEITAMLTELGNLTRLVVQADPADKADLYRELGLRLTYRPQKQLVEANVITGPDMCVWNVSEGGLELLSDTDHPGTSRGIYPPSDLQTRPVGSV